MPQNRLKYFPSAVIRRGMVHFHPALPMPGYLPPRYDQADAFLTREAGGPRPTDASLPVTDRPAEVGALPERP